MRLNHDCVREVLLCIEEHTGLRMKCLFVDLGPENSEMAEFLGTPLDLPEYQIPLNDKYGNDTVFYHVNYCINAELATGEIAGNRIFVSDLTPAGHELLAKIRDPERWPKVKRGMAAVRDYSIAALGSVAGGITSAAINSLPFGKM